ncbi:hypothetical protein DVH24_036393 [Malus domestica]|uniref:Uncharacterized protein n=1 Tax=Malus domestica TaxID=3750 RepID=A0A498IJ87_MALDO|nr:hypothetical protein DVH24_036393 [Malus domestica]
MESVLMAVHLANQVGGESLLGTIKIAVLPIAKVFTVCALGLLMASKYVNIFPASGRKLLNGLVFSLLLPCLIFSQLGQAITLKKMLEWWFIPVNVVIGSTTGSMIGYIVASIVRPPYPFFKFTIIQIGIGNIGNVPLVLIAALCRDKSNPFGDTCKADGTAYISFGQWASICISLFFITTACILESKLQLCSDSILHIFRCINLIIYNKVGAIILYTYVFQMLSPPPEGTFDIEEKDLPIKSPQNSTSMTPEQIPLLTNDENNEETTRQEEVAETKEDAETNSNDTDKPKITKFFVFIYEKLKLKQVLQPPIIASILAMVLGAIPFLKKLIFTSDGPLFFFTDSCSILGEAMIPCILLALGGNLIDGPGSSKLGLRTTAAIIFARLVLVPPVGLGIVMLADKLGFLPANDKMFRFILLLQNTMPTSVLAGAVANLRGCGREAAAVLFWVHIFAIFSMAGVQGVNLFTVTEPEEGASRPAVNFVVTAALYVR